MTTFDDANIVRVLGAFEPEDRIGYVMEYCPEGDLNAALKRGEVRAHDILAQLASALRYLARRGFVHRDIKPANVLIGADGLFRLGDFGLVVAADPDRTVLTTSNWVSRGFAAPEQYVDMASVDARADLYSLGAVHFFALTGGRIFDNGLEFEAQVSDLNGFDVLVLRNLLATNPDHRFQSADELITHIQRYQELRLETYFSMDVPERCAWTRERLRLMTASKGNFENERYYFLLDLCRQLEETLTYEPDETMRELLVVSINQLKRAAETDLDRYP